MEGKEENIIEIKIIKKKDVEKNEKDNNQIKDIQEIQNKKNKFNSLILENIEGLENYLENIDTFPELNYLIIKSATLKKKYYDLDLNKLFPKCTELTIHNTLINITSIPSNLTKLYLTKNEFINIDFKNIFDIILKNTDLLLNLKELSFAKNLITKVELNEILYIPKHKFPTIEYLDFKNNRLTKFTYNPNYMEKLKIIDLSNNLLSRNPIEGIKGIKTFILLCGNSYLTDIDLCKKYNENLKKNLEEFSFPMNNLNMIAITTRFDKEIFKEFNINSVLLNSIKKLNLSYCFLDNQYFFDFFLKNKFENLESLNLTGGDLNDDFFKIFLEKKLNESIKNLKSLNLSDNNIKLDDLNIVYLFIEENKKLSKLNLCKNPFAKEKGYSVISKKQIKNPPKNNIVNGKIQIDDFNSFLNKLNKELVIESKERNGFNLKFDCGSVSNNHSSSNAFVKGEKLIIVKKEK